MSNLLNIFGYCIIPKNTLFFHGVNENKEKIEDYIFFGTKYRTALFYGDDIQIWKSKSEIQVPFLIEYVNWRAKAISSIPALYDAIFPEESHIKYHDLDIKQNPERVSKFITALYTNYNTTGFLTSEESGAMELEICLFSKKEALSKLTLIETSDKKMTNNYKDSLRKIKIFPCENSLQNQIKNKRRSSIWNRRGRFL
ncbi:MAG: hypothetical protein WDO71_18275 [Bacteroidota bacterium]